MTDHPRDLSLAEARALVQRAVDKAEQLGLRGGLAVVGASGALVTASRLDHGGPGGMTRARSKAWIAATQQIPTTEHLQRMTTLPAPISAGFVAASPEALFPGAGGLPVRAADGVVVAGIAASGATVSPFLPTGVAPEIVSADGEPANPEDLLIAYALGLPYVGQHGDDRARWQARFGDLEVSAEDSLGMKPAPEASAQAELAWAKGLCDRVIALCPGSRRTGVSERHRPRWRPDPTGPDGRRCRGRGRCRAGDRRDGRSVRRGKWRQWPSSSAVRVARSRALHPSPFLAAPGGVPLVVDGRVVGGLGVGRSRPRGGAEIAAEAVGRVAG